MKIEIILVIALVSVFMIDYLVRKKGKNSTKEIEKVLNNEIKRKSKTPIYIFSFSIAIALCIVIADKQLYDKTLFKKDGFSFFDKLTSKRYYINDVHTEQIKWSDVEKDENLYYWDRVKIHKVKETMEVIDKGILYNSFGNICLIEDGKFNGYYKKTFEKDSTTWIINSVVKGIPKGKFTSYYKNGNIETIIFYDDGYRVGDYKFYDSLGKKIRQEQYVKGYREGLSVFNGDVIIDSTNYKNGLRNGSRTMYLVDGKKQIINFTNGEMRKILIYDQNNKLVFSAYIKNGEVDFTNEVFFGDEWQSIYREFSNAIDESKVSHTLD